MEMGGIKKSRTIKGDVRYTDPERYVPDYLSLSPEIFPEIDYQQHNGFINISAGLEQDNQLNIVTLVHKDNRRVYIKIEDNGCGIKKEDLRQIFEPFFSTKTNSGGTGLGLSITCNLVQEIGGELSVESKEGKGTTFKITLPLKFRQKEEVACK